MFIITTIIVVVIVVIVVVVVAAVAAVAAVAVPPVADIQRPSCRMRRKNKSERMLLFHHVPPFLDTYCGVCSNRRTQK